MGLADRSAVPSVLLALGLFGSTYTESAFEARLQGGAAVIGRRCLCDV